MKFYGSSLAAMTAVATVLAAMVTVGAESNISFWDTIPGVSQIKSAVQLVAQDKKGAAETQLNYVNEGVGPAQVRSVYFLVTGDPEKALEIQKKFASNMEGMVDSLPVVGHVKGVGHLLAGDHEHGWQAIKSATSSTGSLVGAVVAGPAGAIGGTFLTDVAISTADALINGNQSHPHGVMNYIVNLDQYTAGDHFDAAASVVLDVWAAKKGTKKEKGSFNLQTGKATGSDAADAGNVNPFVKDLTYKTLLKSDEDSHARISTNPSAHPVGPPIDELEPGSSRPSHLSRPSPSPKLESTPPQLRNKPMLQPKGNLVKRMLVLRLTEFMDFVEFAPAYKSLKLGERSFSDIAMMRFNGLQNFMDDSYLDQLDITALRRKMIYMTEEEQLLITKNEFRTVNNDVNGLNCLACSVAAFMGIDVRTLLQMSSRDVAEFYDPILGSDPDIFLEVYKKRGLISYTSSEDLYGIDELFDYLKANAKKLQNKNLILAMMIDKEGHAVVLKVKPGKNADANPLLMTIDYQTPGFLKPNLPNPYRFYPFIDLQYKEFQIFDVKVL